VPVCGGFGFEAARHDLCQAASEEAYFLNLDEYKPLLEWIAETTALGTG